MARFHIFVVIALAILRRSHKALRTDRCAENSTGPKLPDFTLNFLFILSVKGKKQLFSKLFFEKFSWLSAFSGYDIGWKHSLHLENGL